MKTVSYREAIPAGHYKKYGWAGIPTNDWYYLYDLDHHEVEREVPVFELSGFNTITILPNSVSYTKYDPRPTERFLYERMQE